MARGLFILLYDDGSLENCLNNGVFGFFMPPVYEEKPNPRSNHYKVLSDYACCEEGTEIFFFHKRTITYGGKITTTNNGEPVFYLNGNTSPLGRKAHSHLYVDMSKRYENTDKKGVYNIPEESNQERHRAIPFVIEFDNHQPLTGKQITSDELYFELGNYNYPFPSNSIQGIAFCTLTVKETEILLKLLEESDKKLILENTFDTDINDNLKILFNTSLIRGVEPINESHLEFLLLADSKKLDEIIYKSLPDIPKDKYIRCRQVPLCPFKPMQFDRADICLYSEKYPIKDHTLPNIVIELKNQTANFRAYEQVTRYLRWIKQITPEEFDKVNAIIIAPNFRNNLNRETLIEKGITTEYHDKIVLYSLDENKVIDMA